MRPLRVMGLADNGKSLVCEDPSTGEQFSLDCDDRLRAGARGDLSRFGQLEIEMESQLRPRDIQARIRAGASVEQVALAAGITVARVERYAYPVLQERASVVERAVKARPAIDGITARASVAETVAATLAARGHHGGVRWDAFKEDDGWVLSLAWNAGRSENRAHWLFHPGAEGGTLTARDDAAAEIVDPALRVLRPLRPVGPQPAAGVHTAAGALLDPTVPTEVPADRPGGRASRFGPPSRAVPAADAAQEAERMVEETITDERAGVNPAVIRDEVVRTGTDPSVDPTMPTTATMPNTPSRSAGPARSAAPAPTVRPSRRGQRPAMPSWEDVLLGTKSTGH